MPFEQHVKRQLRRSVNEIGHRLVVRTSRFGSFGPGSVIEVPCKLSGHEHIHLGAGVYVAGGSKIGAHTHHNGVSYSPRVTIGSGSFVGNGLVISCCREVTIGERVLVSDRVFIGDAFHDYRDVSVAVLDAPFSTPEPVRIGDGAFIGINAIILPGVTVGERGYVAGGSVVARDVPAFSVVAGNPARVIRRWDGTAWVRATE